MKTDNELVKKYVIPCLNEMYSKSESFFDVPVDFEILGQYAPFAETVNGKKERKSIYGCFYLSMDDYNKILKKYTKGFKTYWHFPYRAEIYKKGEEFEKLKSEYELNPTNEQLKEEYKWTISCMDHDRNWEEYRSKIKALWDSYENKKLSLKECHKKEDEISREYGCQKRSIEKEKIEFTVMNYSPNSNKTYFDMVKNYFIAGANDNLVGESTPDVNKRALEDAKLAIAFIDNVKNNHKTVND